MESVDSGDAHCLEQYQLKKELFQHWSRHILNLYWILHFLLFMFMFLGHECPDESSRNSGHPIKIILMENKNLFG